jgi:hypothetical protein
MPDEVVDWDAQLREHVHAYDPGDCLADRGRELLAELITAAGLARRSAST